MKRINLFFLSLVCLILLVSIFTGSLNAVVANPTWRVDARVIYHRQLSPYDYYGAKDPTIVYSGGKYHVFYTGANQGGGWQMLYTSATTISGLSSASRTYMSKIGESYFCAPEVFYYEPKSLWYLVYQDGTYGAAYSTTTNIGDPNSWSGPKSFGISGNMGWDYFIICDDNYAYMYNTPSDGSGKLYMRRTTLANFPTGWSAPSVSISGVFEGALVYKCLSDGKYYLLIEDMKDGRYYELWTGSSAGGPWSLVAEKWAWRGNLVYNSDQWTTNVSHGEVIRAGVNQKLEINNIDRVDFLIQGTTNMSGDYQKIIWDLGVIHNYTGTQNTPTPTQAATPTPTRVATPTPTGNRPGTPTPTQVNTPTPTQRQVTGNYVVTYTISSDWGSGANADIIIKNNTTVAVNGWTLAWTFPGTQKITNLWNGVYTQSGASVSVKDAGYNATIGANGGTTSLGFGMTYTGANGKPTAFTLNGTACTVQ
ncbi:MAG TPA: non-reducing end alpha-L-arabinofuranosidase family hydrolase [Bacillota bacterium]|nr:non-reducing end alpha-L-arabinofuranosidase family hydrolase [Bacillota bacterium]